MAEPAEPAECPGEAPDLRANHAGEPNRSAGESKPTLPSSAASLQHRVLAALSRTDATIERLNNLISTSGGQESILAAINYSSHALHHLLTSVPSIALQTPLRLLLLPKLERKNADASSETKSSLSPSPSPLLTLSSLMSETRYTLRLFGLIPLWVWGSATLKSPPADPVLRTVTFLQVFVNVVYQALENVAYLTSKGILPKRIVDRWGGIGKWYLWSTRAWLGHVLLQFVRLGREAALNRQREEERRKFKVEQDDKAALEAAQQHEETRKQEIRAWRKSFVNNLAWAPLCVHWSVEQGIGVPDSLTGCISLLAGVWGLCDRWKATAKS